MNEVKKERREKNTGSAIFLKDGRSKPWLARLTIGYNKNKLPIHNDIDSFEKELQALVCLENYHKNPYPIEIKEDKYNKIVFFPLVPYPLVSVAKPNKNLIEKTKKENYTLKQLYEEFKEAKMLTKEEAALEKKYKIRPKNKPFGRNYCNGMKTAFNNSKKLHDKVWRILRPSDFIKHLKDSGKKHDSQNQMINLWSNLDKFALEEDIIEKGYVQHVSINIHTRKEIKQSKNTVTAKDKLFSYEQIAYLWNFKPKREYEPRYNRKEKEEFIRDFWLMLIYSGTRADELISVYTANVFLDEGYFIAGLKTTAGINREIPIHPEVKHLFEKYYNPSNEFLFMQPNGNKMDYDYYLYHYKYNFKKLHPFVSEHTAHDARHTLNTELEKVGVKRITRNAIIGHSNDDGMDDIYIHISIEEKIKAIILITYKETNNLHILTPKENIKTS